MFLTGVVSHDDVIKWKHFSRYWPFVRGIHRSPVNSLHKGQWHGALIFSFICVWINDWENNREAGDLRRYRAHYDIIVMIIYIIVSHHMHTLSVYTNVACFFLTKYIQYHTTTLNTQMNWPWRYTSYSQLYEKGQKYYSGKKNDPLMIGIDIWHTDVYLLIRTSILRICVQEKKRRISKLSTLKYMINWLSKL